jgi:hypothetical protein
MPSRPSYLPIGKTVSTPVYYYVDAGTAVDRYMYAGPLNIRQNKSHNAGIRAVRACRTAFPGMHGTYPAGGEDVDVFIECRSRRFRLRIVIGTITVIIDIP